MEKIEKLLEFINKHSKSVAFQDISKQIKKILQRILNLTDYSETSSKPILNIDEMPKIREAYLQFSTSIKATADFDEQYLDASLSYVEHGIEKVGLSKLELNVSMKQLGSFKHSKNLLMFAGVTFF